MTRTDHVSDALPAYVLDALEDNERRLVEDHLPVCAACRTENQRLVSLPSLLDLVEPRRSVAVPSPPAHLEEAVLARFQRERGAGRASTRLPGRWARSRRGWRLGGAALAGGVAGAVATLAIVTFTDFLSPGAAPERVLLAATDGSGASARATLHSSGGDTRVLLQADGLAPTRGGEVYEVWLVNEAGRVSAGTFTVASGAVEVDLNAAGSATSYDRIGITHEPDAADPALNGRNVLAARLSDA